LKDREAGVKVLNKMIKEGILFPLDIHQNGFKDGNNVKYALAQVDEINAGSDVEDDIRSGNLEDIPITTSINHDRKEVHIDEDPNIIHINATKKENDVENPKGNNGETIIIRNTENTEYPEKTTDNTNVTETPKIDNNPEKIIDNTTHKKDPEITINPENKYEPKDNANTLSTTPKSGELPPVKKNISQAQQRSSKKISPGLLNFVTEMRHPGKGLEIKSRKYTQSNGDVVIYDNCFIGSDAVDWICKK